MRNGDMVPTWARTKEFYALQALWYRKAKQSGFRDIETIRSMRRNLIIPSVPCADALFHFYFNECLAYYHTTTWVDPLIEHIFLQHSLGVSNQRIAQELPDFGFKSLTKMTIGRKLNAVRIKAKLPLVEFNSSKGL
jgi:hypothetical protein